MVDAFSPQVTSSNHVVAIAMVKVMNPVTLNPSFYHCRLISAVFKLCEVEKNACTAKMVDALSPQVTSSTMWLLRRWSRSYLLPDENYYTQVKSHHFDNRGRESCSGSALECCSR